MTSTRLTMADGVQLNFDHDGHGLPFIFQHGLCGNASQTANAFPPVTAYARYTLECRGHGHSEAGDAALFSLAQFTSDVGVAIATLQRERPVVGGISMGASIALKLAVQHPQKVRALVLVRPALLFEASPANQHPNIFVGALLAQYPRAEALERFENSEIARRLTIEAPDNLASLRSFFKREPQNVTAALLKQIASDALGLTAEHLHSLAMPALVIGNSHDHVHPLSMAEALARLLPQARFVEVTAKAKDAKTHTLDVQRAIADFLEKDVT